MTTRHELQPNHKYETFPLFYRPRLTTKKCQEKKKYRLRNLSWVGIPEYRPPGLATNSFFSCFLFVNKLKNHWHVIGRGGGILFCSIPSCNFLVSVSDHWRFFLVDTEPFKGPQLAVLPEIQRNENTVWYATLGVGDPGHHQKQLKQILIVRLLRRTLILDCEKETELS